MTQDEIIRMARDLVTRHGSRMCDEYGETHGEELYCVGVEDIAEIIKQAAAHERNRHAWTQEHWTEYEHAIAAAERKKFMAVCEAEYKKYDALITEEDAGHEEAAAIIHLMRKLELNK